jgi:large subunit ribosomal protein L30
MGIKIKLVKSISGSDVTQRATISGLGLKKFGDVRLLKDTPSIRGMIFQVQHLLTQETVKEEPKKTPRKKTRAIRVRDLARKAAEKAAK